PALIQLLKSGDGAYGRVDMPFAIAELRSANLALLALSEMGPDAHPAVPAIIEMFGKATGQRAGPALFRFRENAEQDCPPILQGSVRPLEERTRANAEYDAQAEKLEFLTCLARIGPAAKE